MSDPSGFGSWSVSKELLTIEYSFVRSLSERIFDLSETGFGSPLVVIAHGRFVHACKVRSTVVIAHGRMPSLAISHTESTGTMHVPFLSRSEYKRLNECLLCTTLNLCRTLGQKWGGGGEGAQILCSGHLLGTLRYKNWKQVYLK